MADSAAETLLELYALHKKAVDQATHVLKAAAGLTGEALRQAVDADPEVAELARRIVEAGG